MRRSCPAATCTRGTYGPYPLPAGARQVSFTVFPHLDRRPGGEGGRDAPDDVVEDSQHPLGRVIIDLAPRAARWEGAARTS